MVPLQSKPSTRATAEQVGKAGEYPAKEMKMNEYQINVSANGHFMFRTEWDDNKERVGAAAIAIQSSMLLTKVEVTSRCKTMRVVSAESLLS